MISACHQAATATHHQGAADDRIEAHKADGAVSSAHNSHSVGTSYEASKVSNNAAGEFELKASCLDNEPRGTRKTKGIEESTNAEKG